MSELLNLASFDFEKKGMNNLETLQREAGISTEREQYKEKREMEIENNYYYYSFRHLLPSTKDF